MAASVTTAAQPGGAGAFPALLLGSSSVRRIVIIGGGSTGLALALALRLYDARCLVTLLERRPLLPPDSHGLALAPNGLQALATLGLLSRVRAVGRQLEAFELKGGAGLDRTVRFDFACLNCLVPYGVGVLPRTLSEILTEDLRDDATMLFDQQVIDIRPSGSNGSYEVLTRSGGQEHRFSADVVIGADGVQPDIHLLAVPPEGGPTGSPTAARALQTATRGAGADTRGRRRRLARLERGVLDDDHLDPEQTLVCRQHCPHRRHGARDDTQPRTGCEHGAGGRPRARLTPGSVEP